MRAADNYNPITVFVYLAAVLSCTMFEQNPIVSALSLLGAVSFYAMAKMKREHNGFLILLFMLMVLANPLFSHNGATILFFIGDNAITLESAVYGFFTAISIIAVILWFKSFSQIMTSDKLLYLFGRVSKKLALILSLSLRYIPLFKDRLHRINQSQRALGLYREDTVADRACGGIRVMDVMVTWVLENGIITADSMTARGYGIGRRTSFSLFSIKKSDIVAIMLILLLTAAAFAGKMLDIAEVSYYPRFVLNRLSLKELLLYLVYGLLLFLPVISEIGENIKWRYLRSKI